VHKDVNFEWTPALQIKCGNTFEVASFHDGVPQYATGTTLKVTHPDGTTVSATNGATIITTLEGTYKLSVTTNGCGESGNFVAQATVTCTNDFVDPADVPENLTCGNGLCEVGETCEDNRGPDGTGPSTGSFACRPEDVGKHPQGVSVGACQFNNPPRCAQTVPQPQPAGSTSSAPLDCGNIDVNGDNKLDIVDVSNLAKKYKKSCSDTGATYSACGALDTNQDGTVNISDLGYFAQYYKKDCRKT
jgi:hypothetical protein